MAISLLHEGLSLLKPCPTVHNMWNWSFLKEYFFPVVLASLKEKSRRKYKRSQNTYYSQCDSAGNRRARKESKIEISWVGAEERRQERSLLSCREVRITLLFIDIILTLKGELRSWKQQMPKDFASLSNPAHLCNLAPNGGSFRLRELQLTCWQ